jgi:hypothetical protein
MDYHNSERIVYRNGIWDFQSFGQSETQKLRSIQPLVCPESELSSEVNFQNSVTSEPLVG